jgi:hypothetical protein
MIVEVILGVLFVLMLYFIVGIGVLIIANFLKRWENYR